MNQPDSVVDCPVAGYGYPADVRAAAKLVADILAVAPRIGVSEDVPEGNRYVQLSDTLAIQLTALLRGELAVSEYLAQGVAISKLIASMSQIRSIANAAFARGMGNAEDRILLSASSEYAYDRPGFEFRPGVNRCRTIPVGEGMTLGAIFDQVASAAEWIGKEKAAGIESSAAEYPGEELAYVENWPITVRNFESAAGATLLHLSERGACVRKADVGKHPHRQTSFRCRGCRQLNGHHATDCPLDRFERPTWNQP